MKNTVAIYTYPSKNAFLKCQYSNLEIEASGSCVCRTELHDRLEHIMLPVVQLAVVRQ